MEMDKCPKCGNKLSGSEKYCSSCGVQVHQQDANAESSDNARPEAKRKRRKLIIILAIAAIVIGIILFSFLRLTSKFLKKEPVQVITPPALNEEKQPEENLVQVLVSPNGKVYLSLSGTRDTTVLSSDKFKEEVLTAAYNLYRNDNPNAAVLSQSQNKTFCGTSIFGVPMRNLPQWLDASIEERDEILKKEGIPIENNSKEHPDSRANEFQKYWLPAIKNVFRNHELDKELREGNLIAIKAGEDVPFNVVHAVMENLQTANLNKFVLMTSFQAIDK